MQNPESASARESKKWLMFLLKPNQLLALLRVISHPTNLFAAGTLPPDVRPVDTFYDNQKNFLGLMLESDFFEPVQIEMRGDQMSANWPRAIFTLEPDPGNAQSASDIDREELWSEPIEGENELQDDPMTPFHELIEGVANRGFRVRALNFSAGDLLMILRSESPTQLPIFPVYDEQVQIINALPNPQIGGWTLFLEHPDFDPAPLEQAEGEVLVKIPGDGHDMTFRFALPGATLQRKIGLDADELNEF